MNKIIEKHFDESLAVLENTKTHIKKIEKICSKLISVIKNKKNFCIW